MPIVPWRAAGEDAAARLQELSPVLAVRATANNVMSVDVHATVRALVDAATDVDNLTQMPSAYQGWL